MKSDVRYILDHGLDILGISVMLPVVGALITGVLFGDASLGGSAGAIMMLVIWIGLVFLYAMFD